MRFIQTGLSFVLLLIVFSCTSFAQSNYKKGLVVKTDGDTLHGFINYQEWYRNPREISFKSSLDDKMAARYSVSDCQLVEVEGYETYQQFPVLVSMNEVQFGKLTESTSQPEVKDTVLLKLLVKGKNLNLYSYRDLVKQRFYILEKGESIPLELGYRLALVDGNVVTFHNFRQQLLKLNEKLNNSSSFIRTAIERSAYVESDLVKIINSINGETESKPKVATVRKKSSRFFLSAGINHSLVRYSGVNLITANGVDANDNRLYKNRQSSAFMPLITMGTDIYFKPEVQKLYLKLEIAAAGISSEVKSLYKFNIYTVEELSNTYQLSGVILSFRPQLLVNVVNKEKLSTYFGAGASLNYLLATKNEMYQKTNQQDPPYTDHQRDNYMFLKDMFASVLVRAGVTINKKLDISICQYNPVDVTDHIGSAPSARYYSTQLSVGYKFGN